MPKGGPVEKGVGCLFDVLCMDNVRPFLEGGPVVSALCVNVSAPCVDADPETKMPELFNPDDLTWLD